MRRTYAPALLLPALSSIDHMELHLMAKERAGAPLDTPLETCRASSWGDLEALLGG